jgi:hypothetical protein
MKIRWTCGLKMTHVWCIHMFSHDKYWIDDHAIGWFIEHKTLSKWDNALRLSTIGLKSQDLPVNKYLVVRQEIKIFVTTKQARNSPQIFPNWRLSPNSGKSWDFCPIVESLKALSYLDNVLCSMNRPHVTLPKQVEKLCKRNKTNKQTNKQTNK